MGQTHTKDNYPIFSNPKEYLEFRRGNFFTAPFRRWSEWRSLDKSLEGLDDIRTVCDCPCGPGRLFEYWKKHNLSVTGVDLSDEMLEAARQKKEQLNLSADILKADAFFLHRELPERPDIIVSIRFFYYFDRDKRIQLLRSFAAATRKYVLVQYKTAATLKGCVNFARSHRNADAKQFCSYKDILDEIRQANLTPLRIIAKGDTSDRLFVLAQKTDSEADCVHPVQIRKPRLLRSFLLSAAAVLFVFSVLVRYRAFITDAHERQVERLVMRYQDGNDHFYVSDMFYLEDLRTGRNLSVIHNLADAPRLAETDRIEKEDSYFLVLEKDLRRSGPDMFWRKLRVVTRMTIGEDEFVLLSTENSRFSSPDIGLRRI